MSHGPPPPPPPSGNFYAFSPFNLNDLNNAQNSQFPAGGPSNHDLMSFFDDADMMDPFGDVSMNIDSGNSAQVMHVPSSMPANTNEDVAMMNDANAQASSSNIAQPQDDPLAMTAEKVPGAGPLAPRTFAQMSLNGWR
ncbi:hypothetical protein J3459_012104 [Metarhizium acridum]|nr:hypothetical protein J3459_012104 [Metarhizium acridum]